MKLCLYCKTERPESEFQAGKHKCKACKAADRAANKEAIAARKAIYRAANREKGAARWTIYYAANSEKTLEARNRRRCAVASQTPKWADRSAVLAIYRDAKEFRAAGLDVHVDHIVPLKGKLVSGLHNEFNLTIKMAYHNDSKGAKFDPLAFDNRHPQGT